MSAGEKPLNDGVVAEPITPVELAVTKEDSRAALPFSEKTDPGKDISETSSNSSKTSSIRNKIFKFAKFLGPGMLVSVGFLDPGNYSTNVNAGAKYEYKSLSIILFANFLGCFLQYLAVRLGTVTGLDLAQNTRRQFPRWISWAIYIVAEYAMIATDMSEVIGAAISMNLLFNVPLPAGVAITVVEVMVFILFYKREGYAKGVRIFELILSFFVLLIAIFLGIMLGKSHFKSSSAVIAGFLPHKVIFVGKGLQDSLGLIGASVAPHALFLGSGLVQTRLREHDTKMNFYDHDSGMQENHINYRPTLSAIKFSFTMSVIELVFALFVFALFANAALVIIAGATLAGSEEAADADLFTIFTLLSNALGISSARIYAISLLFSGILSGIIVTMGGQMISEGLINWTCRPWLRRLLTRCISIVPSMIIAISVGRGGLSQALNYLQYALSYSLPFITFPLIWMTNRRNIMKVKTLVTTTTSSDAAVEQNPAEEYVYMQNGFVIKYVSIFCWIFLVGMIITSIVFQIIG